MPRYFFHIQTKDAYQDHEGLICSDLDAARSEAIRTAAEILKDKHRDFWVGESLTVQVRDENGIVVCDVIIICQ